MKVTPILRTAVIAWAVLALPASAWGASAKDVFTKVAPSVVVVLALDEQGKTTGQGSGVVVGEYEVVTNCHVLGKAADVAVRQAADWSGRETYRMAASLLARNDERDLCLLFVDQLPEPPGAQAVRLGAAKSILATALKAAHEIDDAWDRSLALRNIAVAQAKAGDITAALEVAQPIDIPMSLLQNSGRNRGRF